MKLKIGCFSLIISTTIILLGIHLVLYLLLQDRPPIPAEQDDLGEGLAVVAMLMGAFMIGGITLLPMFFIVFAILWYIKKKNLVKKKIQN